ARTEQQLRRKLAEGFYPEEAADYAIAYCKDKHYIDDEEYARRYIELKTGTLSKKMIEQKLYSRGIGKDITENAFEETGFSEDEAIRSLIRKKIGEVDTYDREERQKVIRKLMSKGFSYDSIRRVLDDTGIC
nr:recombination regulator RecX [Lachnospiraceae bacterium]